MNAPVDLTNLRSMTDGDTEVEKVLFEEFCSSCEQSIAQLHGNFTKDMAESWRKNTHALKGISLNLGAKRLGELCKRGQDEYLADAAAKEALLHDIEAEYALVKAFIAHA